MTSAVVCLRPEPDGGERVDAFVRTLATDGGGRIGLAGILTRLDRHATTVGRAAPAADYGFRWDLRDQLTREWWPQGITTAADAGEPDVVAGRRVLLVAWYAKTRHGRSKGVRISFVDVTDPGRPRYRHVLLVAPPFPTAAAASSSAAAEQHPAAAPVLVHAGGLVWCGGSIWVADTRAGFRVFDLADLCRAGGRHGVHGYHYLLPQRSAYRAENADATQPFRFSFLSLDRTGRQLVAGEYGRHGQTTRLARFALEPATMRPVLDSEGCAPAAEPDERGPEGMQGAVLVNGQWLVTTSSGPTHRGCLWSRRDDGPWRRHEAVLSVGPEDLTYWPGHDRLWTCSEWPLRRYVYAMRRAQFTGA